jgi:hypothetical protein
MCRDGAADVAADVVVVGVVVGGVDDDESDDTCDASLIEPFSCLIFFFQVCRA